jgi:hypothetical protein
MSPVLALPTSFRPSPSMELESGAKEYFYSSPLSLLLPQYYVVRFDSQDRLSGMAAYSSPQLNTANRQIPGKTRKPEN